MMTVSVTEPGSPEALRITAVEVPDPEPGDIRVRVEASGVNFIDVQERRGTYPRAVPFVPGYEAAGVVDAVGDGVELRCGTRVAVASERNTYAEYVTVPAGRVVPIPDAVSSVAAAALLMQGLTAHGLVTSAAPVSAGHRVLVLAAAGGVGRLLVQLSKRRGAEVVGVASTPEKRTAARAAGADRVIGYDELSAEASRFDVVFDGVGAATFGSSLRSVGRRGTLALFGMASGPVPDLQPQELQSRGSIHLTWFAMNDFIRQPSELRRRANSLLADLAAGRVTVHLAGVHPLREAACAHSRLESREVMGKLVLVPD
jgi:NADPH:quinone reductase